MKNKPLLFENGTKVRTGEVRLSFAHLFTPHAAKPDQRESYNTAFLIPKTDSATLDVIRKAIENAKEQGVDGKSWKRNVLTSPKFHEPLRDGDEERPDDPAYENMFYVNAKSYTQAPAIIDSEKQRITDETQVYSGCWGHVSCNFYAFDVTGNRGIACGLNGFMKSRDDEALSGAGNVLDDFDGGNDDFLD